MNTAKKEIQDQIDELLVLKQATFASMQEQLGGGVGRATYDSGPMGGKQSVEMISLDTLTKNYRDICRQIAVLKQQLSGCRTVNLTYRRRGF